MNLTQITIAPKRAASVKRLAVPLPRLGERAVFRAVLALSSTATLAGLVMVGYTAYRLAIS